jgi:hypothetical protein
MIVTVDDALDPRLNAFRWRERQLTTIAQRKSALNEGLFIAEGDLVVHRALEAGCIPDVVLCDPKCAEEFSDAVYHAGGSTLVASADIRREVTGLGVPLDAIGVFKRPPIISSDDLLARSTRLIVLDCVDNPSNVGSIARTAAALGWDGLLLDSTSSDPLSRRALRVSASDDQTDAGKVGAALTAGEAAVSEKRADDGAAVGPDRCAVGERAAAIGACVDSAKGDAGPFCGIG